MNIGISCLFKNVPAISNLQGAIKVLVADRINQGKTATFPEVYSEIRRSGVEVDAETLGTIYNVVYGSYNVDELSTIQEVEDFAGTDFKKQINALTQNILGENNGSNIQEIGNLAPEKSIVNSISKLFQKENFPSSEKTKSDIRSMEDMVLKSAKALLKPTAKKAQNLQEALQEFFKVEIIFK
mgnify:FL=1